MGFSLLNGVRESQTVSMMSTSLHVRGTLIATKDTVSCTCMLAAFLDPRTKLLLTFGTDDRDKIWLETRRRALIELQKQKLVPEVPVVPVVPDVPVVAVVDKFGDLFDDMDAQVLGPVRL